MGELRAGNEARCRRLLERSELLVVDDLDWDQVGEFELDRGLLDSLVYMRDVEGFTSTYLVGLGAHKTTLADPLVRDFLEVWEAEEAAHSSALARFLDAYAEARSVEVPERQVPAAKSVRWHERALARVGGPFGTVVAAAHMAWGAANELLTMNGYRLLARQCDHPMLAELMGRIAAQESRHYSFYLLQAEWRLAASRTSRVVLPRVLRGSWTPVGIGKGYKTPEEFDEVLRVLGARPEGQRMINRMDRRFSRLPGFDRLRIYREALRPLAV